MLKCVQAILLNAGLLWVTFLVGCSGGGGSSDPMLQLDAGDTINSLNVGNYHFKGRCLEDGQGNVQFSVTSSGSPPNTAAITGSINCEGGKWVLPLSEHSLSALADGEITLSLSLAASSVSVTVTKDIVAPVISNVVRTSNLFEWDCDGVSSCSDDYTYRSVVNTSSTHTFSNQLSFSSFSLQSLMKDISSNGGEDFYLHIQARDASDNLSSVVSSGAFRYDNTAPTVQNLSVTNSAWGWGCSEATCLYRSEVNTSSSPPGTLSSSYSSTTSVDISSYASGTYYVHVQARDTAGNESSIETGSAIAVSNANTPVIRSTSGPAAATYSVGQSLDFQLVFDRTVQVDTADGTPRLPLQIGTNSRFADYLSGSDSTTLIFRYVVVSGDNDGNGVALGSSGLIDLNGGTINTLNNASLSFSSQTFNNVLVDGLVPSIVNVTALSNNPLNTAYAKQGDTVTLTVLFNENVTATGFPPLIWVPPAPPIVPTALPGRRCLSPLAIPWQTQITGHCKWRDLSLMPMSPLWMGPLTESLPPSPLPSM